MSFIQVFQVKVQIAECKHNGNAAEPIVFLQASQMDTPSVHWFHSHIKQYLSSLYKLYLDYEWPQVLEYHFKFHNHHIVEMTEGNYRGWEQVDSGFMSIHLYGHPKIRPAQPGTMLPGTSKQGPFEADMQCISICEMHIPLQNWEDTQMSQV